MALSSTGLTNNGAGAGLTNNFQIQYEDSLPGQANVITNANALMTVVENEFTVTTNWFNTPAGKFGTGNRQVVRLNRGTSGGANNSGYGNPINQDSQNGNANAGVAAGQVEMVWMNEWSEILMSLSGGKWNAGDSMGEGLSQYCGIVRFQAGHYNYYNSWVDQWLNLVPRQDWVNSTEGTDANAISFGCALGFIYYLNVQLNFTINEIIASGDSTMTMVYQKLTGDTASNPFEIYSALLEHAYPSSATAAIPGPVSDNPFPIAIVELWANKDTFGRDEVQDVINRRGGVWSQAFWLVVDGFSKNSFNSLGVAVSGPTGPFANLAGVTITRNPNVDFENGAQPAAAQRIRIPFDVTFTNASLANFPANGTATYGLTAFLTIGGNKINGSDAATIFELVAGADPYFTNIDTTPGDPIQNNVFYLSQDLRIFTATPGQNNTPVAGAPAFANDSVSGAFSWIQQLLVWLNQNFSDPSGPDPFNTALPGQGLALTDDSSVSPFTVDWSNIFNIKVYANYNFAIARVRLTGTAGPPGAASNTRVFFRLWSSQTADTDYQTGTTYRSDLDAAGLPASPLVGSDHTTIPFFATGNLGANSDYGGGGANTRDIEIAAGNDQVWAYYGCFLNVYDPSNVIDGQSVQARLTGTHHCLVAQIAQDDVPVPGGASPAASDKLAQRNLQVTLSDNPGPAETHRIPQTFDTRPSRLGGGHPDELMIDWGSIPAGSLASIYWPKVPAADVVSLARALYGRTDLTAADATTVQCKVTGGVTYIPIPPATGDNFAGLFTVDLPTGVTVGQEYHIIVRRVTTREFGRVARTFKTLPSNVKAVKVGAKAPARAKAARSVAATAKAFRWRRVIGNFAVKIPVTTREIMLWPEENTLAIMRWRLQQLQPASRWRPVLERYVGMIADRVDGLGGDSDGIEPSPFGVPVKAGEQSDEVTVVGKVSRILFNCFGDFEGFVIDDCHGSHSFHACHKGVECLVLQACRDELKLAVTTDRERVQRIRRIAILCC